MLKLSKLTDYAIVVLVHLPAAGRVQTAPSIAATTGLPEPTVSKVLKTLSAAGLVASQRGARGGYALVRPLAAVSVAEVIAAMEGPVALVACVEGSHLTCEAENTCPVRGRWDPVNTAVRRAVEGITLAEIAAAQPARPNAGSSAGPRQAYPTRAPAARRSPARQPDAVSS